LVFVDGQCVIAIHGLLCLDQVSRQVFGEVIGTGKCFAAGIAPVRPFTSVNSQVTVHVALATKGSSAKFALERPLTRVFPDVQLQILLGPEAFAAEWAQVRTPWVVFRRWARHRTRNDWSRGRIHQRWTTGGGNSGGSRCSRRR
jgi:hypothetical protein